MTIDPNIVFGRPGDVVFAFVSAAGNIPKWRPEVTEVSGAGE